MASGQYVDVRSPAAGDVITAAQEVSIDAPVTGYVAAAGRYVALRGPIANDVWAAGETVRLDTRVGDNATLAGRRVDVGDEGDIEHNATIAGNSVTVLGRVGNDLRVAAASVQIGATVGGSVRAYGPDVRVLPDAAIEGDLIVRGPQAPVISPQASVRGRVDYQPVSDAGGGLPWPLWWLYLFLALMALGAASYAIWPVWTARVSGTIAARPGLSFLAGFAGVLLTPVVVVLLLITLVGLPLGLVLLATLAAAVLLSGAVVTHRTGEWLVQRAGRQQLSPWSRLAAGALVVSLGLALPWLGGLVALAVVFVGVGAVMLARNEAGWLPLTGGTTAS